VSCRLPMSALIAAMLATPIVAGGGPVAAKPLEQQENSLRSAVDSFVSYLKSESNEAAIVAARIARQNKDILAAAKSGIDAQIDAGRALLSGRKARLTTLGKDASAMWEAWRGEAVSSWAKIERLAHGARDWIATWMRNPSLSDQRPETLFDRCSTRVRREMENQHSSEFGTQSTKSETSADKEWSEFERDLDTLGHQLAALQAHTAALGGQLVSSLEARFQDVKNRAQNFRQTRELELEQMRQAAWQQATAADGAFSDARTRSTEAARQVWERSEPLRQGAKDVGEGLARAWVELRASFGKAAGRLHTESTANGPAPAASEEHRETT
jgi:hypothetical protein